MSTTSRIYPVLAALYTAYDAISSDLTVYRGKSVTQPDGDFLCVGWAPNIPTAVTGAVGFVTEENVPPQAENFSVTCYLETMTGDTDNASITLREQRLLDYWDQIRAVHVANPRLGVENGSVELTAQFDVLPDQTTAGFVAGLIFRVAVFSYI